MKKDLEIYLHIPFCVRKCRYCDFLSFPSNRGEREAYVKKMAEEIRSFSQKEKWAVTTIFFGGGTPSILEGNEIAFLMDTIREEFDLKEGTEISIECNPGTVDTKKLNAYREAGVNRISFGLQSAQEKELKLLGRIHTYETFVENYEAARKCGFQNINVDLMSALPAQTAQSWRQTLEKVLSLKPEHISAYSLMIEEGTPFFDLYEEDLKLREAGKECHLLPSENTERQMYYDTREILEQHGYFRYEISNYARPGYECRHNIGYWERKDYAGFGLGAAGLIENVRFKNTSDMHQYMQGEFGQEREELDQTEQMEEFMFLGLRMMRGVSRRHFFEEFGVTMESVYGIVLNELIHQGLLEKKEDSYRLSDFGIDVSNYVLAQFLL
ncbi:MAG: radical SAM family heme chaperone HemW [Lachnospiraceae bacterium]|nr:radical SAM family heme chaperone HemW [Robinsoniella sp.]MDY3767282.1 radical SAM family heme chaperone HemW [Lachnospiraceae bacterium]